MEKFDIDFVIQFGRSLCFNCDSIVLFLNEHIMGSLSLFVLLNSQELDISSPILSDNIFHCDRLN